jgi:phage gp29-like protein
LEKTRASGRERTEGVNPTGQSQFDQARIEWAIRMRYSPMPKLTVDLVASNLNAFRIGELRVIGKYWEVMMERDGELAVNADKRASDLAGLEWKVVSDGSAEGDEHAAALNYFYKNVRVTRALDQDAAGGVSELLYQMASAHSYFYSAHEILLRIDNAAAREVTAELRHTPVWFFESRRGYLGYLQHIFDVYGQPCLQGEWLTCVGSGWMRALSLAYVYKNVALRDWVVFSQRYGSGFLEGITDAQKGDPAWEEALETLNKLSNDGVALHNRGVTFKTLEMSAGTALPFAPLVEQVDRLYAKCYRGIDLATGSRTGEPGRGRAAVGASVQKEESGIFLARDAKWATGYLNERVDRPVIRFLFDREPRAGIAIVPPLDDTSAMDLQSAQILVPLGLRISLEEAYKRFRWTRPVAGEACLQPAAPEEGGQRVHGGQGGVAASVGPDAAIGAGANPSAETQSASPNLPDAQVDAADFWSAAAITRGES